MTHFKEAKHQQIILSASLTTISLEAVPGEPSKTTKHDLDREAHVLTDSKNEIETQLTAQSESKAELKTCRRCLKYSIDSALAYGHAEDNAAIVSLSEKRVAENDIALAGLLAEELTGIKGALPQALAAYLMGTSTKFRKAEATLTAATARVDSADMVWSSAALKVQSLTTLGASILHASGLPVPRKNPARGPGKKKVDPVAPVAGDPAAPVALTTGGPNKAA